MYTETMASSSPNHKSTYRDMCACLVEHKAVVLEGAEERNNFQTN